MRLMRFGLGLLVIVGCAGHTGDGEWIGPSTRSTTLGIDDPPPPKVHLTWRRARFTEGQMELSLLEGPASTHPWDRGGVVGQSLRLGDNETLDLLVRAGDGETLASLVREHRDAEVSDVDSIEICGRPAERIEVHTPEQFIECIEYADERPSSPGYIAAETTVAVHFVHRGLDVIASWRVPTALRDDYRADEARFFAGLHCF